MANKQSSKKSPAASGSSGSSAPRKRALAPSEKNVRRKLSSIEFEEERSFLDDRTKRTIIAILFFACACALMLIVVLPGNAMVSSALSYILHVGLGIGAYILPVVLAIIGITFIARFDSERVPARVILGLFIVYLGLLILLALLTPGLGDIANAETIIFLDENTTTHGGLVGAGPGWVGLALFGLPIAIIIALSIIAIGFAVIGFSIHRLAETIARRRAIKRQREEEALDVAPAQPYIPAMAEGKRPRRSGEVDSASLTRPLDDIEPASVDATVAFIPASPASRLSGSLEGGRHRPVPKGETQSFTRKLGQTRTEEEPPAPKTKAAKGSPKKAKAKAAPEPDGLRSPDDTFQLPDRSLLKVSRSKAKSKSFEEELRQTAAHLQQTMEDFGIMATVVDWISGPTVTLFEVDLPAGVRVSRLTALKDDIALALAAPGVRIFAPIPNTHFVGIEVPNRQRDNVLLGDILKSVKGGPLEVAIGKDVEGNPIIEDLARMPHLLIGGTTGSGKSVGINAMIMSILMRSTPSQVRFIMIDPKRVEFAPYDGIPHLYVPVVTEPKEAASALSWGVAEMELRLKTFQKAGVRNITSFNELVVSGRLSAMAEDGTIDKAKFPQPQYLDTPMPYIVIVIDELADLMMNVGKEVEFSISRIAQLARAAGIHLIVATQRPSANVVTGLIKANITTRIAYNVASGLDSRVILDTTGAESLIGLGDLLISKPELGRPLRVQGCFTSDEEIATVVEFIKSQGEPEYHSEILKTNLVTLGDSAPDGSGGSGGGDDPLIWDAAEIVVATGLGSTSNIQRKLKVGYARAGRIMDMLEEKGVVGAPNGSKPREVLVDALELEALKAFEANDAD